jgi:hypothetical protein
MTESRPGEEVAARVERDADELEHRIDQLDDHIADAEKAAAARREEAMPAETIAGDWEETRGAPGQGEDPEGAVGEHGGGEGATERDATSGGEGAGDSGGGREGDGDAGGGREGDAPGGGSRDVGSRIPGDAAGGDD